MPSSASSLAQLSELHSKVLRLRYGLYGGQPLGVGVVARHLGTPWPKVKELEAEALARLAAPRELDAPREAA